MTYKMLPLDSLVVNPANDRHGELENETAAIARLFALREQHMRSLAKDLVAKGGGFRAAARVPGRGQVHRCGRQSQNDLLEAVGEAPTRAHG